MKRLHSLLNSSGLLATILIVFSSSALSVPPIRAARLNHLEGDISFLPAGESEWGQAQRNFTLTTGDSLWNDKQSHSMLQLPQGSICLGAETGIEILNLNDDIVQIELQEGAMLINIANLYKNQSYEIDTPNLAFTIKAPGTYRVDVDKTVATLIRVDNGRGEVYGEQDAFYVEENQAYRFLGTNLEIDDNYQPQEGDALDEWCYGHLTAKAQVKEEGHVSPEVVGYEDLAEFGTWEVTEEYGYVWTPTEVTEEWAPYRVGSWSWVSPWGWTWISEEPWGFAPYHYGRWVHLSSKWFWVPGEIDIRPVYAPALVVFATLDSNDIAWFPLGPGEIYVPPYPVNQIYFSLINRNDPRIDRRNLSRAFRGRLTNVAYRNLAAQNAISAIPQEAFRNARRADRALIRVQRDQLARTQFRPRAQAIPDRTSLLGTSQKAKSRPPRQVVERRVLSKAQVPPAALSFEQRKPLLEQSKGRPLGGKDLEKVAREPRKNIHRATHKAPQTFIKGKRFEQRQRLEGDPRQQRQKEFKRHQLENLQQQKRESAKEQRLEQKEKRFQDREQRKQERLLREQRKDRQLQQQQQEQKMQDKIKDLLEPEGKGDQTPIQQEQQKVQEQQQQIQEQIQQRRERREKQVKPYTTPEQQDQPGEDGQKRLEQQQQELRQRRERHIQESTQEQSTQQRGLLQEQQEQLQDQMRQQRQEQRALEQNPPQNAQESLERSQEQLRQRREQQLEEQQQRMRERQERQQQRRQQQIEQQQQQTQDQLERQQRIQQEQLQQQQVERQQRQQERLQQQQSERQQRQQEQLQQRQLERQQRQQEQLQQRQLERQQHQQEQLLQRQLERQQIQQQQQQEHLQQRQQQMQQQQLQQRQQQQLNRQQRIQERIQQRQQRQNSQPNVPGEQP